MDPLCKELYAAVITGIEEGELPEFLLEPLLLVAANPTSGAGRRELVELLLRQVREYDPYASSGCFKDGYDAEDIRTTLAKLEG